MTSAKVNLSNQGKAEDQENIYSTKYNQNNKQSVSNSKKLSP